MTTHTDAYAGTDPLRLPVLMYHSISRDSGPLADLAVPPATLREQLSALTSAGYRLVGLTDALDLVGRGEQVAALTFDDAYRDFLTEAVPILREFNASATLYVPVGDVGARAGWLGSQTDAFGPILTWRELHEVVAAGVEIGNHGLVHAPLDVLPARVAADQITASRDRLAQELREPIRSFCYPHGYHSATVRGAVVRAGHGNACAIGRRVCKPHDDRFAIPRLQPTPQINGEELLRLVRAARADLTSTLKRAAQPGWRVSRRVAYRAFGVTLT